MKRLLALAILLSGMGAFGQAPLGFTKLANVSALTYTDTSCPDGATCYYQVTVMDATGHESTGASCAATQLCLGGNQAAQGMPSSGTHTVTLTWIASPTSGVTYNVYQHIGPVAASGLAGKSN
jgi:fibronectin type 3 domain-containing protein